MKKHILGVEDSPTQAEALRDLLETAGYLVTIAPNGEAAAAAIEARAYDVVVSDIVMPGAVDGYELCRRIKAGPRRDTPVVLLTSLTDPMDIIKGLESGADNFLTKPYEADQLLDRLHVLLDVRSVRRQSKMQMAVQVFFMGRQFSVTSEREQILDLLISTFEDAVRQNRELRKRDAELSDALARLRDAQDALVRRERLAMLGQLASGVGHELRNPLGVMTNAVYYLKMVLASSPANVREYLDILQQQIGLSEKIVGDLLDFARSKPPQRRPTLLSDATAQHLARLGAREGIRIETDVRGDLPAVLVDPVQLGQILLNLLTNAVQALEAGGRIALTGRSDGDRVVLDVSDSGPGVPPELTERIFEPLFTTKARGIGLGLAVSRQLARANGGDLTMAPATGGGAVFSLTLPIAAGGEPAGAGPEAA